MNALVLLCIVIFFQRVSSQGILPALNANASNVQTTSFDVMWEDRPEFSYPIYIVIVSEVRGTFSTELPAIANRDGDTLTVNAVGLTPGTEYNVSVQGVTNLGQREGRTNFTVFTRPNPPINGRFSDVSGATILLSWDPPADGQIDGYIVVHASETKDSSTFTRAILPIGQTTYTITGLSPLNPYIIRLMSYRNSEDNFSDFAELLQEGNSNLEINQGNNPCAVRPCQNGGQCFGETGSRYRCECISGFNGTDCEVFADECASILCQNGGNCINTVNGFLCLCPPGITGITCEININECASAPCQNGASCFDIVNAYICNCTRGFTGVNCTRNIDECNSFPCQNGASCIDLIASYTCSCPSGFVGNNCETPTNKCRSQPCLNGGTCIDMTNAYTCLCSSAFSGLQCEIDVNECLSGPCLNGATCLNLAGLYQCQCAPGFVGTTCAINFNECASSPCQNGATCFDVVNAYICYCPQGFSGVDCATNINECTSEPCANGGTCTDGFNQYMCTCAVYFEGPNCLIATDRCLSNPCRNGATCISTPGNYICHCLQGFYGRDCDVVLEVTVIEITANTIKLKWPSIMEAIVYSITPMTIDGTIGQIITTSQSEVLMSNLIPLSTYIFTVRSLLINGSEMEIGAVTATTIAETRISVNLTDITSTSITLTWRHITSLNFRSYEVRISEMDGLTTLSTFHTITCDVCTDTITDLTPGTEYKIVIYGVTPTDQKEEQTSLNTLTRPDYPRNARFEEQFIGVILFSWDVPLEGVFDGFILRLGTEDMATSIQEILPPSQFSHFIRNLSPYQLYTVNLFAYRGGFDFLSDGAEINQFGNTHIVINRGTNPCAPIQQVCLNGGECYGRGKGNYECRCLVGFSGNNCELVGFSCLTTPCLNGGTCSTEVDGNDVTYSCMCTNRFAGQVCQSRAFCRTKSKNTVYGNATLERSTVGSELNSSAICPFNTTQAGDPILTGHCAQEEFGYFWTIAVNCGDFRDGRELLEEILEEGILDDNLQEIAHRTAIITMHSDDFTSYEVNLVAEIMDRVVRLNSSDYNVTTSSVHIVNNIMNIDEEELLVAQEQNASPSRLVQDVEMQLGYVEINTTTPYDPRFENIAAKVQTISNRDVSNGIVIRMSGIDITDFTETNTTVAVRNSRNIIPSEATLVQTVIPAEALRLPIKEGTTPLAESTRITFMVLTTDVLYPSKYIRNVNQNSDSFTRVVNTPVMSVIVDGRKIESLTQRVNLTFSTIMNDHYDPVCTFWDSRIGNWSTRGCNLIRVGPETSFFQLNAPKDSIYATELNGVTCACDHLTSFAVIVDIYSDNPENKAFQLLSIIGCGVSIISLVITIVTYFSLIKEVQISRGKNTQLYILLCFYVTLLGLYIAFLTVIGFDAKFRVAELEIIPCSVIAALTHFFALSSLTWMGIEGFHVYMTTIRIFNNYIPRFMLKATLVGWGVPAIIVGATGGLLRREYALQDFCYIQRWALIGGLLVPMGVILFINIFIFILAICQLGQSARLQSRVWKDREAERRACIERTQDGLSFLVLMGLTWTTGYLVLLQEDVAEVLFIIFNSFQGFFIFVLTCVRKKTVRRRWRKLCCPSCSDSETQNSLSGRNRVKASSGSNNTSSAIELSVSR